MHEIMLNITGYQGCRTTINYHFTRTRMAIISKRVTSVGKNGEEWKLPYPAGGGIIWHSLLENSMAFTKPTPKYLLERNKYVAAQHFVLEFS